MASSPDTEPTSLAENERLLASSSYVMRALRSGVPRYRDGLGDTDIENDSTSLFTDGSQQRGPQAELEGNSLTTRPNRTCSLHGTPTESAERVFHALSRWVEGPQPPRPFVIKPVLSRFQTAPLVLLNTYFPGRKHKFWLLVIFYTLWSTVFLVVLCVSVSGCQVPGHGAPVRLSCVSRFWPSSTSCGIDGANCRPFHNKTFAFRCPANCQATIISSPETIGGKEYNYRSIVIGGSITTGNSSLPMYRGDSFICGAAIHAGILKNPDGGSGIVSLIGEQSGFPSTDANGISSIDFLPSFPLSFTFPKAKAITGTTTQCSDPWWRLAVITALLTCTLSICTTSPSVFFGSTFVSMYFYVALASDPPDFKDYLSVVSSAFHGFLPAVFVGLVIYHFCVHHTLRRLTAQFEKTVLWLGGCWLGALSNLTFERLPIQRLTPHDLQQPGAILTLVVIISCILCIALFQAWAFRVEGRMPRYLTFYACVGLLILALIAIPHMNVRIHHYILALLLVPGTTLQTRPSLLYQGLLVGLFINGIARWGFDSILQTSGELFGDGFNSPFPVIAVPSILNNNNSISFSWSTLQSQYDSISVVVNDVERFRGYEDHEADSFTWTRHKEGEPEYFRFGFVKYGLLSRSSVGRLTMPGTWEANGTWVPPASLDGLR